MRWFTKSTRPARPGSSTRTFLRLEQLGGRDVPSTTTVGDPPDTPDDTLRTAQAPPTITFTAGEVGEGLYWFTGQVTAAQPGGLTVTFTGVPSLNGHTVVTNADGSFSFTIPVQTNGTDNGTVTATVTDSMGQVSNVAMWDITPTP
jgi:hypothetical protein